MSKHPLVKTLLSHIHASDQRPDPEATWLAYRDLFTAGQADDLPSRIPVDYHQAVLRAIAPGREAFLSKRRQRRLAFVSKKQAQADGPSTPKDPANSLSHPTHSRYYSERPKYHEMTPEERVARTAYIRRVEFILDRLQMASMTSASASSTPLPSIEDYKFLLRQGTLAQDHDLLGIVWDRMVTRGVILNPDDTAQAVRADEKTYHLLTSYLLGHIKRQHKQLSQQHLDTSRKPPLRNTAAWKTWQMEQERTSSRALDLFKDMTVHRQLKPTALMTDKLCQILRLCGQNSTLEFILRRAYDVDLQSLDGPSTTAAKEDAPILPLTVHTFNTILMALGETRSVSEMMAAFETLRHPLGVSARALAQEQQPEGGSVFKTDFKGLLKRGGESTVTDPATASSPPPPPSSPPQLRRAPAPVNTHTFYTLIAHAALTPEVVWSSATSPKPENHRTHGQHDLRLSQLSATELRARQVGMYWPLAKHALASAVEQYEEELQRVASGLGYSLRKEAKQGAWDILDRKESQTSDRDDAEGDEVAVAAAAYKLSIDPATTPPPSSALHQLRYDPPTVTPLAALFNPLFNVASERNSRGLFYSSARQLARTNHLLQVEYDLVERAQEDIAARIGEGTEEATRGLLRVQASLASQMTFLKRSFKDLQALQKERVIPHMRTLQQRRATEKTKREDARVAAEMRQKYEMEAEEMRKQWAREEAQEAARARQSALDAA